MTKSLNRTEAELAVQRASFKLTSAKRDFNAAARRVSIKPSAKNIQALETMRRSLSVAQTALFEATVEMERERANA